MNGTDEWAMKPDSPKGAGGRHPHRRRKRVAAARLDLDGASSTRTLQRLTGRLSLGICLLLAAGLGAWLVYDLQRQTGERDAAGAATPVVAQLVERAAAEPVERMPRFPEGGASHRAAPEVRPVLDAVERGELEEAQRLVEASGAAAAGRVGWLHLRGLVARMGGRYDEAERWFAQSEAAGEFPGPSLLARAEMAWERRNPARAAALLGQLLKLHPRDPELWQRLGLAEAEAGRADAAVAAFDRARALEPGNDVHRAWWLLARWLQPAGRTADEARGPSPLWDWVNAVQAFRDNDTARAAENIRMFQRRADEALEADVRRSPWTVRMRADERLASALPRDPAAPAGAASPVSPVP